MIGTWNAARLAFLF